MSHRPASIAARKRSQRLTEDASCRSSPVIERLAAGEGAASFVGPLGSFKNAKQTRSAKDLLKSRAHDETSQMLCRSQSQKEFERFSIDSSFAQTDPTAHYAPSDRIGRNFTPTAKSLTMKRAQAISKAIMFGGSKLALPRKATRGVGPPPVVTAPAAYNTMAFGFDTDILDGTLHSTDDGAGVRAPRHLPALDSPHATRSRIRQARAVLETRHLAPTPLMSASGGFDAFGGSTSPPRNLDNWDPLALSAPAGSLSLSLDAAGHVAPETMSPSDEARQQLVSIGRFWDLVESAVQHGALHAAGAGQKRALAELPTAWFNAIANRVSGGSSAYALMVSESFRALLATESHAEVASDFVYSVARSMVEYELRDSIACGQLEISRQHLDAAPCWWCNPSYTLPEWRVLRETGVPRANVHRAFHLMERRLCIAEAVMLELQDLWCDGMLPADWDKGTHGGDEAREPCAYSALLLTDVSTTLFRRRLPMSLEAFCSHVERRANSVREALKECWIAAAAGRISEHLERLRQMGMLEETNAAADATASLGEAISGDKGGFGVLDNAEENEFDSWWDDNYGSADHLRAEDQLAASANGDGAAAENDALLKRRMQIEGLESKSKGGKHGDPSTQQLGPGGAPHSHVNGILDASATLMSRHLRGTCERSLESFADFFDRFGHVHASEDSAFKLHLRLNDNFKPGQPVVRLEPSLEKLQEQACACIEQIVLSAQRFPRSDAGVLPPLVSVDVTKHLGPCAVVMDDELVGQVQKRVRDAIALHFKRPAELVAEYNDFAPLLSGEAQAHVAQALGERVQGAETVNSLELLSRMSDELKDLSESIRDATPDLCHYKMFSVHCFEAKGILAKKADALHAQLVEAVVGDNREHMNDICHEYQEVVNTLIEEPTDSAELRALQEYSMKSVDTLSRLLDEYLGQVYERVRFLLEQQFRISKEDLQLFYTTYNWPNNVRTYMARSQEIQQARKRHLEMVVEGQQEQLSREMINLEKKVEKIADAGSLAPPEVQSIYRRIVGVKESLEAAQLEVDNISQQEELLQMPITDNDSKLTEITAALKPLEELWRIAKEWVEKIQMWQESPLADVDAEDAERKAVELGSSLGKVIKALEKKGETRATPKRAGKMLQQEVKIFEEEQTPLMKLVCTNGIKERHWGQIKKITHLDFEVTPSTNMIQMLDIGLQHYVGVIEDTCVAASKENALDKGMDKMEEMWKEMKFETKEWRGSRILAGIDEIQQELDDQIVKTQAMRGSRFIKPFLERINEWEKTLTNLQDIMDNWLKVQAAWLYLEPIFSSDDIMRQMPTEAKLFITVNNTWKESMADTFKDPGVINVARRPGLLEGLLDANSKLDTIQKGLNNYLETKRLAFPRFFFLSNDELLEILAETKDPTRVQPHLKKAFDGIAALEFTDNLDILACYDGGNPKTAERIEFMYEATQHKPINPKDSGGNVEQWLVEVETIMKKSLAHIIDLSVKDYLQKEKKDWVTGWAGQVVLTVNQIMWSTQIEDAIREGAVLGAGEGLVKYRALLQEQLMEIVEIVRSDIPKRLRTALGALVVMDVHNRDTTGELGELKVADINEFDWLAQLRYVWNDEGVSALSGTPATIDCKMINAQQLYAYEYLGNGGRLVITPLTDRCYRTLMGAIHLNLGGAPEGPAGTGKTETTKDLGKAIAIQCVVTNCSDGLDYKAMGKFFKGLAASGAWACFDEFNRITLEVLSVVAQQVLTIQQAKARGAQRFDFEGTNLPLVHTCCPFITMNPGYAGRAELPDNLKVLFRTVAMMVPDYGMISEIMLYSFGYTEAKPLSVKIVMTYKLCSEQLSSQTHYDYGMRAVMAVLRAAGNLKRSDGHLPEDVLMLRSIIDVNLCKFLSPDVPLFNGIVSDLFPGVEIEPPDRTAMQSAFIEACGKTGLQAVDYFWEKTVQFYDMMVVRHGFMIVGMPFSGKTSVWKTLAATLGLLHERFPEDTRWTKVVPFVMNPKSITMGQLYGCFDDVSHEWTDGILAINYRNAAANKVGNPEDRKWVLFDGPVDAIWIENMNTVLDDNKKLCLMSGEIIAMTDVMSMIFEPMDLLVASPATVSRCGMVYMEPEQLGWKPVLDSWLDKHTMDEDDLPAGGDEEGGANAAVKSGGGGGDADADADEGSGAFKLTKEDRALLEGMFNWLVEPCMAFLRRELVEMSPTVDTNLLQSLINILECQLLSSLKSNVGVGADADVKDKRLRQQHIESAFMFALIWSCGVSGTEASQARWTGYLREIMDDINVIENNYAGVNNALQVRKWTKPDFTGAVSGKLLLPVPNKGSVYDYCYIASEGTWRLWIDTLPKFEIEHGTQYSSIVVPTSNTAQMGHLLELLLKHDLPVLICGPTGTGKSANVMKSLFSKMPQDKYKPLCLGFSAKTTASMTQDTIDGKLDKRRKGVYGPPLGQKAIIFVDDLNMPEVETYGAQPPIELLRQFVDSGGWFDMKEKMWQSIVDTVICSAMGPPGGGRNETTPRFLRHFNLVSFGEFDNTTLTRIFSTIVDWYFTSNGFSQEVQKAGSVVVAATLDTYRAAVADLLPTPAKSHYTFNLRDFSRVIQGTLMVSSNDEFGKPELMRLWTHEALRVFGDRLTEDVDRDWFFNHLESMCSKHFSLNFADVFSHLDKVGTGKLSYTELRGLFYGDYMTPTEEDFRPYDEVQDLKVLQTTMETYLAEFNQTSRKPMNLVMFMFAIEHVSRISRVLRMPGGNALLVGVGGSGRQSVSRLAAHMSGCTVKQIEISKNYGTVEWREDLKLVLQGAGTSDSPLVFLFSDTQIKREAMVEDINNMLNSGEVPNLFANDEKVAICELVRPFAKEVYGRAAQDMAQAALYQFFVSRVRSQLHIVLAFSPIGDAFRDRLRKFPSLVNCCAIDWFTAWPDDALVAVAEKFLADVDCDSDALRHALVDMCQMFHENTRALSAEFGLKLKRINYVTPTSYLELIIAFKTSLAERRTDVQAQKRRYEVGLEKLEFATVSVNNMQKELVDLQPVLARSQVETDELMEVIQNKLPGVEVKKAEVNGAAEIAQAEADKCQEQKDGVKADLDEAMPALNDAIKALDTIKPGDIQEIKALAKPPATIKLVCEAICVMLGEKAVRIPDPNDPSKRIMDFWGPSVKLLGDPNFITRLKTYDKDNISPKIIKEIQTKYMTQETFNPVAAEKASKAAAGLCKWCFAMETYDRVAKVVGPKREELAVAEETLAITMKGLNEQKAALKLVEDDLQGLQDQLEGANKRKADLGAQVDLCGKKLVRAKQLIDGLGGEKSRWEEFVVELGAKFTNLTGDVLCSAGLMAYLGPFTANYRSRAVEAWVSACKQRSIPCSDNPTLENTLGEPVKIRQWIIDGLPTDAFSVDNGIIVFKARRWPLMIDPQGQANNWIRTMEKDNHLHVLKLTDGDYVRTLESAIAYGQPVLIENIGEELDPTLEPLLLKQIFKQGGCDCIRLGDSTVEYSEEFRFYMTTKLRNPHYVPEVSVKVTLLNFMITPEGLQDQLLGVVVAQERADLEEKKNQLIIEGAENKRLLKEIEDQILHILSSGEGNILEDEGAIDTLKQSKITSDDIKEKQEVAEKTEREIDEVRKGYTPIAYSTQVLFFCISDLANIQPVYTYSLNWFVNLFIMSIQRSEKSRDIEQRMKNLDEHFTYSLYANICRSLLEKDKLLFSFLLTVRILGGRGEIDAVEWLFLLTGGVSLDNPHANPAPDWLGVKQWNEICILSDLSAFHGLREEFEAQVKMWKRIYDSTNPHEQPLPRHWDEDLRGVRRLCALRTIRPDKVSLAVQAFVVDKMGEPFVKPPPFDLAVCYDESSCSSPLIFILSPGSDPMAAVFKSATELGQQIAAISLGQGQGPIAERLIGKAREEGSWVVLQNCHLGYSFMTRLEQITEQTKADNTHEKYRLWCTTYPSPIFPTAVLQNGVKMTIEPPKGLSANLKGSFTRDPLGDPEFYEGCSKGTEFRKLSFALCMFHANVQERRLYGPLGWNIPYEFNESDFRMSVQQLSMFLDENETIPFKALQYTVGECNYGGRVTDDKDRILLMAILKRFYTPDVLTDGHKLVPSGVYSMPPDGSHEDYIEYIESLPLVAPPEVFGLHDNANITKDNNETTNLLDTLLLTEGGGGGGGSDGPSVEDTIENVALDVLAKLPNNYDMEEAMIKYPVRWEESMNTVLCQELIRFNKLISVIRSSLSDIKKAVKGLIVMSGELETLGNSLFYGKIPIMWKAKSYPSLKPLSSYVLDLLERIKFLGGWLSDRAPPVFWLSGFFFTQAFLTGSSQNYARKNTIPIDDLDFDYEMMPKDSYRNAPRDGVYTYGLFFEGCRWDKKQEELAESVPKVLFSPAPIMWFKPLKRAELTFAPHYNCPTYKTSDRRGILSTSGHSTNFIIFIRVPSSKDPDQWTQRGVAMMSQLDD